jgi:hypothetical protein
MGIATVPLVETKRIPAVQRFHGFGQLAVRRAEHKVEVVRHQAVRKALQAVSHDDAIEARQEVGAVGVEAVDRTPIAAPREDVVRPAGSELTSRSGHFATVATGTRCQAVCEVIVTLS